MTLPRKTFQTKRAKCASCGEPFGEKLIKAGRPPSYCRRCRKDYKLYPGASRRKRERIRDGWDRHRAHQEAMREIRARLIGVAEEED